MNDWKEYYLTKFLELNPKVATLNTQEYSFVEMPDLEPGRKYVFPSRKRKPNGLTKFQNGDTLFAKITPCLENGKICQVKGLEDNIGVGSTEFFVFRGKENVSDNDFVHYLLKWYPIKKYAEKNMSGSAGHQRVPVECLHKLKLFLPPHDENKKIGSILSCLDSKIENLQKQNQTLEKIAQTLFKQWFVDFNFPDENEKPYKDNGGEMVGFELGEIPKGWKMKKISDLVTVTDFVANGSFKSLKENVTLSDTENFALYIRLTDYHKGFKINLKYVDKLSYDFLKKSKLHGEEVIISNIGANAGTVFRPPSWINKPMSLGSNSIMFFSEDHTEYLYYYLFTNIGKHTLKSIIGGSAQPKFNKTDFRNIELIVPDENLVLKFTSIAIHIRKKIFNTNGQILTLTLTRDTLLPKLMSGQIRVSD